MLVKINDVTYIDSDEIVAVCPDHDGRGGLLPGHSRIVTRQSGVFAINTHEPSEVYELLSVNRNKLN